MNKSKNKNLNRKIISSSTSVIISLSLVLFVVGLLSLVLINAQKLSNYIKENVGFSIMIKENTNQFEIKKFNKSIDAMPFTKSTSFISKEVATSELESDLGEEFVDFLGFNPILASIDVKLSPDYSNNDSLSVISNNLIKNSLVHEIYYQKNLISKINNNVKKLSLFLLTFCIILFFIAFALINNTIRLSVYSKRFLIKTMRLVGAKNSFIQKPFILDGIYQGMYSAIFAIFMLMGSIQLVQTETASLLNITDLKIIGLVFILIFIIGIILSSLSTYFAVKKFINVSESELYN
ncbi:MAG: cell division protein FtsX [Flavobacteriales bacterium]|jgi:cell division transport system permease protein|nr:permease-like cell division protein FtsX [Flavobacteriales bacterium]|tara:strand:+ start:20872 stop:21750 length:879 start_codon:yes stop_codon:yes gene_type:complete